MSVKTKDKIVATRVDEDLYDQIKAKADRSCRKVSDEIRYALTLHVNADPQEAEGAGAS